MFNKLLKVKFLMKATIKMTKSKVKANFDGPLEMYIKEAI